MFEYFCVDYDLGISKIENPDDDLMTSNPDRTNRDTEIDIYCIGELPEFDRIYNKKLEVYNRIEELHEDHKIICDTFRKFTNNYKTVIVFSFYNIDKYYLVLSNDECSYKDVCSEVFKKFIANNNKLVDMFTGIAKGDSGDE